MVLRGGRGIDPSTGRDEIADVFIEDERVVAVEPTAATAVKDHERDTVIIDCVGHPRGRGGGFTTVCAMPNTKPVNDHREITGMMVAKGKSHGLVNLRDAGCVAVCDDGRCATDAGVMRRALEYARTFGLVVVQHAEDHVLTAGAQMHEGRVSTRLDLKGWPRVAEDPIVARDVLLTQTTIQPASVPHMAFILSKYSSLPGDYCAKPSSVNPLIAASTGPRRRPVGRRLHTPWDVGCPIR
jgi:dihydroorotase